MPLTPAQEIVLRAQGLGAVLNIDRSLFAGTEEPAYYIMSHTLCIPTLPTEDRRTAYINELLPNVARLMPRTSIRIVNFWAGSTAWSRT